MCKIMDDLISEAVDEAVEKAVKKAAKETAEQNKTEFVQKLLQEGTFSLDRVAYLTSLPVARVQEIANQLN